MPTHTFSTVLVATDFSAASDEALGAAIDAGKRLDSRIEVIHVIDSAFDLLDPQEVQFGALDRGGAPPQVSNAPPGYSTAPAPSYDRGYSGRDDRGYRGRGERSSATLFARRSWRGASSPVYGPTPDLGRSGLNDRVRSIQLDRRSGPWLVCSDAYYRGRCVTIRESVSDTRRLGLDGISSLRPRP